MRSMVSRDSIATKDRFIHSIRRNNYEKEFNATLDFIMRRIDFYRGAACRGQ